MSTQLYEAGMQAHRLVEAGDSLRAYHVLDAFLFKHPAPKQHYDSVALGYLYARAAYLAHTLDYPKRETQHDDAGEVYYYVLPDVIKPGQHRHDVLRWAGRAALAAGDSTRAVRLLLSSSLSARHAGASRAAALADSLALVVGPRPLSAAHPASGGVQEATLLALTMVFNALILLVALSLLHRLRSFSPPDS